ncbi:glycosyltransferase family 9 protein [Phenylobacterium sp.]|uniref:glycosyltransferase family 9 protein n=1 Tax=Phenylobacterium sp. TaxID=1871053 RepID=UPI002DF6B887|nr:tetratricopeptide repeat protein [Phenylobacterium sp.]
MPDLVPELHEGGDAHVQAGRFEDALAAYRAAVALEPASAPLHYNIGNMLRLLRRFEEAIASYGEAIALRPDFAMAHHNRAHCRLQIGALAEGFGEYEWRKACPTFDDPRYALPDQWAGQDLAGKTLFIYPELFMGDLIQFCRYALMAERLGAKVRLGAPAAMHALLRTLSRGVELLPDDASPEVDGYRCALMSLPALFGTTLETVPWAPAYLRAEPARVERWRSRIGEGGFKIGVAWQGSIQPHALPLQRSYPLAALDEISRLPGVRLISLQKQNGLDQLANLPPGMAVETLGEDFDPGPDLFLDTAAAMMGCDLFITPDTSVAHLAGALGVPTWVALPWLADWRWLNDRRGSPWYPSLRLFRQQRRGEWGEVFAEMAARLRALG